jgi:hypothetical protein
MFSKLTKIFDKHFFFCKKMFLNFCICFIFENDQNYVFKINKNFNKKIRKIFKKKISDKKNSKNIYLVFFYIKMFF